MPAPSEPSERSRGADDDRPRATRSTRRVVFGGAIGAVLALLLSSALSSGLILGGHGTGNDPERVAFAAPAGTCLAWAAADGADVHPVDCAQPHLFESVGELSLGTVFGPAAAFPSETAWLAMVKEKCTPLASRFLDERYDPFGRFTVGALKPSRMGWRNGDRTLRCGLQVVARSDELYSVQGPARGQDQANVHATGTCLGIDGVGVGDPVDCAQPHAVEVVGVFDLSGPFPESDYPDENKQDEAAGPACTKLASDYAGGPDVVVQKKLTVYWDTLRPESWRAGTRRVDCKLGALLPDKSGFAPVTGDVRGEVSIGNQPAPPAPTAAVPGAPAKSTPATPPATSASAPATSTTGG